MLILQILLCREHDGIQGTINRATFARDGICLTDDKALMEFYSREVYCLVNYLLSGLPRPLGVQFDSDTFMKSISFVHADGKRRTVAPWTYPPGWRAENASRDMNQVGVEVADLVDQIPYRRQAREESKAHDTTLGQFLPHVVAHDKVPAMMDEDIENIIKQGPTETVMGDMIAYSYGERIKVDSSLADTVQGQIVPTEEGEVDPSDDEDNEDKSEDVPVCNPAFDALVDTERNTKAIREFARKKAESARRRKLAKLMRETKERAGKGKKNAHGKGKGPGKGRRKNHGPGKGAADKGSGTGKGPSKASVPVIGPPTSTPESEDEFLPTPSRNIAASTRADMEQVMRESRSRARKAREDSDHEGEVQSNEAPTYHHKSTKQIVDFIAMPPRPTSSHARVTNDGNESVLDADEASSMLLHDAGRTETPCEDNQAIREYTPLSKENSPTLSENRVAPCENSDTSRENSPTPSDSNSKALEAYHTYWKGMIHVME
jgi:hypothetical protein